MSALEAKLDAIVEKMDQMVHFLGVLAGTATAPHPPAAALLSPAAAPRQSAARAVSAPLALSVDDVDGTCPSVQIVAVRTGSRRFLPECVGCDDLACAKEWLRFVDLPSDPASWLANHGFFSAPTCPTHGANGMKLDGIVFKCRVRDGKNRCRYTVHQHAPLLSGNSKLDVVQLFTFWAHVANNEGSSAIARLMNLNKNTVMVLFDLLSSATYRHDQSDDIAFNRCAVDETYVGKRKYNRGRRARLRGHWFVTMTEIQRDGRAGRTLWTLVRRRDKKTLQALVEKRLVGMRTVVVTDEHKGYKDLSTVCRHFTVNHRKEYVSQAGYHTNHAEGAHSVVKRYMLNQHHRFGLTSALLRKHVSLQCAKFLSGGIGQAELWGHRLQRLLLICKKHYNGRTEHLSEITEDTVDDIPAEVLTLPKSQPTTRLTKSGLPDRRAKSAKVPAPVPAAAPVVLPAESDAAPGRPPVIEPTAEQIRHAQTLESDRALVLPASMVNEDTAQCLESVRPKRFLLSPVVYRALQEKVQPGWFIVDPDLAQFDLQQPNTKDAIQNLVLPKLNVVWPLWYANHWVVCIIKPDERRFLVFDSLREYARALRKRTLARVQTVLYKQWHMNKFHEMKQCEQQKPGSNDCGLFAIRNGLAAMGVDSTHIRRSRLKLVWQNIVAIADIDELDAIEVPPTRGKRPRAATPSRVDVVQVEDSLPREQPLPTPQREATPPKTQAAPPTAAKQSRPKAAKKSRARAPREPKRKWTNRKRK